MSACRQQFRPLHCQQMAGPSQWERTAAVDNPKPPVMNVCFRADKRWVNPRVEDALGA